MPVQITMSKKDIPEHLLKFFKPTPSIKRKDDTLVPYRFALAVQADGWHLRSGMPWLKRNAMPESATDRPTTTIEYVYLLAKSQSYYFDAEAIKQPSTGQTGKAASFKRVTKEKLIPGQSATQHRNDRDDNECGESGRLFRSSDLFFKTWQGAIMADETPIALVVNTNGYSGAHFATFPEKLVDPMILAGTSAHGVCSECGAPWVRAVEKIGGSWEERKAAGAPMRYGMNNNKGEAITNYGNSQSQTTGWRPSCKCEHNQPVPATVLDCFNGSGTTGRVANRLGRAYIGVDVAEEYLTDLSAKRMENIQYEMSW